MGGIFWYCIHTVYQGVAELSQRLRRDISSRFRLSSFLFRCNGKCKSKREEERSVLFTVVPVRRSSEIIS